MIYHEVEKIVKHKVVEKLNEGLDDPVLWLQEREAMNLLGITSKTTLQKLRNNNFIRFTQPFKKVILYDKNSILDYLNKNSNH